MGADDPDPGGPIHPAVFYGLWPRFAPVADEAGREDADHAEAEPVADA